MRKPEFKWIITNDMDTNLAKSSCTYDRIIITAMNTTEDYAGKSGVFRFDSVFGSTPNMAKKVSDHYPVYGVFYVNRDKDQRSDTFSELQVEDCVNGLSSGC